MGNRRSKKARDSDRLALRIGIVIGVLVTLMVLYYMITYSWWTRVEFWLTATVSALIGWLAPPMGRSLGNKGFLVILVIFVAPQLLAAHIPWLKPYIGMYYLVFLNVSWWRVLYDVFVNRIRLF